MIVTAVPGTSVSLPAFAAAGFASCELDIKTDSYASWKGYVPPSKRSGKGSLGESIFFAKYHYNWKNEDFILYTVVLGYSYVQYVLKEPRGSEHVLGPSNITDEEVNIEGVTYLGSYSWIEGDKPTILVPGTSEVSCPCMIECPKWRMTWSQRLAKCLDQQTPSLLCAAG